MGAQESKQGVASSPVQSKAAAPEAAVFPNLCDPRSPGVKRTPVKFVRPIIPRHGPTADETAGAVPVMSTRTEAFVGMQLNFHPFGNVRRSLDSAHDSAESEDGFDTATLMADNDAPATSHIGTFNTDEDTTYPMDSELDDSMFGDSVSQSGANPHNDSALATDDEYYTADDVSFSRRPGAANGEEEADEEEEEGIENALMSDMDASTIFTPLLNKENSHHNKKKSKHHKSNNNDNNDNRSNAPSSVASFSSSRAPFAVLRRRALLANMDTLPSSHSGASSPYAQSFYTAPSSVGSSHSVALNARLASPISSPPSLRSPLRRTIPRDASSPLFVR